MDGPRLLAGRYRLVEPVGRGGMAEVWRGEDVRLGRPVAVKLIFSGHGDWTDTAHRARREARDAARLLHPNVVTVYDVEVDRGRLFIVMEWVAGRDLATVLARHGPFPPVQVAWIGAQTARALAAAHAAGIVHRDVKPANLMLTRGDVAGAKANGDGVVKLADFGIAAPIDGDRDDAAEAGFLLGTTAYVSPEQVLERPAGPASDLYGLGCALYELLTGRPPFTGQDSAQVMRRHVVHDPVPPSRLRADVPAPLERLILRLLAKDPASRPADARKVAQTLEAIAAVTAPSRPAGSRQPVAAEAAPGAPMPVPRPPLADRSPQTARMTGPLSSPEPTPDRAMPARSPEKPWRRRAVAFGAPLLAVVMFAVIFVVMAQAKSPDRPARAPAGPTTAPAPTASSPPPSRPVKAVVPAPKKKAKAKSGRGEDHQSAKGRAKDRGMGREKDKRLRE